MISSKKKIEYICKHVNFVVQKKKTTTQQLINFIWSTHLPAPYDYIYIFVMLCYLG